MRNGARPRATVVAVMLVASAAGLAAGYALKSQCTGKNWDGIQYRRSCYSDVYALYFQRGIAEGRFPYVDANLEYPAGTGIYIGAIARVAHTPEGFVAANAVGIALMGLGATAALTAMALERRRVLLFAIAPAVVLYAFHNWDLLAVGFATFALYAFWRGSDGWAGLLLGLGAATKLYPAFLLPALVLAAWRRDRRAAGRMGLAFGAGAALLNIPILLANFQGWKYPWVFQSERFPNFETSWYMIWRHIHGQSQFWLIDYPKFVNVASGALFAVAAAVLIAFEARRDRVRPYALGFGLVLLFLLTAKVFSPQYALWLLPFFVLVRMPWYSYVAFAVTDAAVWFSISGYFLAVQYHSGDPAFRLTITEVAVWVRYAVLLWLLWLSRGAHELVAQPESNAEAAPVALVA